MTLTDVASKMEFAYSPHVLVNPVGGNLTFKIANRGGTSPVWIEVTHPNDANCQRGNGSEAIRNHGRRIFATREVQTLPNGQAYQMHAARNERLNSPFRKEGTGTCTGENGTTRL